MSEWRFDVENAPRGTYKTQKGPKGSEREVHQPELVVVASEDGKTVTVSRWIPDEGRWNMLGKRERPLAWQPFPKHPNESQ